MALYEGNTRVTGKMSLLFVDIASDGRLRRVLHDVSPPSKLSRSTFPCSAFKSRPCGGFYCHRAPEKGGTAMDARQDCIKVPPSNCTSLTFMHAETTDIFGTFSSCLTIIGLKRAHHIIFRGAFTPSRTILPTW